MDTLTHKIENLYTPKKIRTYSGKYINPLDPDPELICIEDIAHALSNLCRFGGHTKHFFSVAQHSINVYWSVSKEHDLAALLHDASEAYLLDIPSPIKELIPAYKAAENRLMEVISKKFGFKWPLVTAVKDADKKNLEFEWDNLVLGAGIRNVMAPEVAKVQFLEIFKHVGNWLA